MKKLVLILLMGICIPYLSPSQAIIKIVGDVDAKMVKSQVVRSLNYLEIQEPVCIHIAFTEQLPANIKGTTRYMIFSDSSRFFRIRMDAGMDETLSRNVLAHEMMHVRQYLSGDLKIINGEIIWKGEKYPYLHRHSHHLPWERDAYRYDQYLTKALREMPGRRSPLLASEFEK
jgi:hypothetical protein